MDEGETPRGEPGLPTPLVDEEIARFARAIARVVEGQREPDEERLRRAGNTSATAFQFLVLRRGADYARALGRAAAARARESLEPGDEAALIDSVIADIHDRVCRETE
jgi:hypothetical protein